MHMTDDFQRGFWGLGSLLTLGLALLTAPASAVIVQNTGGSLPTGLPSQTVGTWGNFAGAVAVAPSWVLTTRHQEGGGLPLVDRQVVIDGQTYDANASNQIVLDPSTDLRLVKLTDPNTGVDANLGSFVDLYEGSVVGQTFAVNGFGPTIGSPNGTSGFDWSGPQNNSNGLTWGQNRIDGTNTSGQPDFMGMALLRADFDDAAGLSNVPFEATLAPGDSGGGWFIFDDGEYQLVGLTSSINNDPSNIHDADAFFSQQFFAVDIRPFVTQINNLIDNATLFTAGDYNGDNIVSQADLDLVLLNWGASTIPTGWLATNQFIGTLSQNELDNVLLNWGTTAAPSLSALSSVPEPGSALLVIAGTWGLLTQRRHATNR